MAIMAGTGSLPLKNKAPGTAGSSACAVALRASTISGSSPCSMSSSNSSIPMRSICKAWRKRRRSRNLYSRNRPSKVASISKAVLPMVLSKSSTCCTLAWKITPTTMPVPLHSKAPSPAYRKNRPGGVPSAPDMGAATVLNPGTNLETIRAFGPQRLNLSSVWLTQ